MLLLCAAYSAAPAADAERRPLLVLSDTYDVPYTTQAGDGFLDLVLNETFRRAGFELKLIKVSPERAPLNANAGVEDGVSARIAGLDKTYTNLVRVPEKVLDFPFAAFAVGAKIDTANWDALAAVPVGHIKGWKIFEQSLKPGTPVTIVDTAEQLFTMLDRNRIDVALYERWLGLALAKKMGLPDVRVVEPTLVEREMFVYLHHRHTDKVPAIAAALGSIKNDGLYTRLCREKFAPLAASTLHCEVKLGVRVRRHSARATTKVQSFATRLAPRDRHDRVQHVHCAARDRDSWRRSAIPFRTICARRCAASTDSASCWLRTTPTNSILSCRTLTGCAAPRMGVLIDDILRLSRISRADLVAAPLDLGALAAEVMADLERRGDLDVAAAFSVERGLESRGDAALLRIVIENLLDNVRNTHAGRPSRASSSDAPRITVARPTTCATTASASTCRTRTNCSACSSACTARRTFPAPASA